MPVGGVRVAHLCDRPFSGHHWAGLGPRDTSRCPWFLSVLGKTTSPHVGPGRRVCFTHCAVTTVHCAGIHSGPRLLLTCLGKHRSDQAHFQVRKPRPGLGSNLPRDSW